MHYPPTKRMKPQKKGTFPFEDIHDEGKGSKKIRGTKEPRIFYFTESSINEGYKNMKLKNNNWNILIKKAMDARKNAYAPYSKFSVGAALLEKEGSIYQGCNIENSTYGLTVCAESVALFKAVSEGKRALKAIAIVADTPEPVFPCGACRQILAEFNPDITIIMTNLVNKKRIMRLSELLPKPFYRE
jgi:cytidine deaminase